MIRASYIIINLLFLVSISGPFSVSYAQKTVVKGKVTDKVTGEVLPFAKVFFTNSKIAVSADIEGNYRIESYYATDSVSASMVGYTIQTFKIKRDEVNTINFKLSDASQSLTTVTVSGSKKLEKDGPAIVLWKKIQRNKKANNREKLEAYEYEVYNKVQFDLNNLSEKFTQRKLFKHFDFIFENIDSTNEKPSLPLFMTESLSDYFYRKNPKSEKEYIKATRISGVSNESVSQFMGDMYQNVNIYDSKISVFNKSFISPLAGNARVFYDFFLEDSASIDGYWCYKLSFVPKRKQEPTFIGNMWVNDTSFAIKSVKAEIADDANINFVQTLVVEQNYEEVAEEVWMLVRDKLFVEFYLTDNTMGIYARKNTSYKNFNINEPRTDEFYNGTQNIVIAEDVNDKPDEFWEMNRHLDLSESENMIYHMMDTLGTIPQVRTYIDIITLALTGYKEFGKIEIGPIANFYSYNIPEGHRFGFGMRTSNNFSTRIKLKGRVAYGLNDDLFKYAGGAKFLVNKQPRQIFEIDYKYDVEQLGWNPVIFSENNVLASLFRRNPSTKLTLVEEYKNSYDHEWFPGFNSKVAFMYRNMKPHPLGSLEYQISDNTGQQSSIDEITTSEISYYTRFAYGEKFVAGEFNRISLGTRFPVIEAQYSYGMPGFLGGDYEYHKIIIGINDWFPVGIFGWSKYKVEAGKHFGILPYPLLEIFDGNETYFYQKNTFNTMNFFEFVADQYITLFFTHHLDGFIFNRIPLLRKLKWREVASFNAAWGEFSDKHKSAMDLLPTMHTLGLPFMEASLGIENIFKFIRVDVIKRLNYLDHPDIVKWGIRVMFDVDF